MPTREVDTLLNAKRFRVVRAITTDDQGRDHEREVIRHPGSVVVLPLVGDDKVCLIRNYRAAVDEDLLELPAGTLEPSEPPQACAERELTEETGYTCQRCEKLTSFFAAPGILDEHMHLFAAHDLTAGAPAREAGRTDRESGRHVERSPCHGARRTHPRCQNDLRPTLLPRPCDTEDALATRANLAHRRVARNAFSMGRHETFLERPRVERFVAQLGGELRGVERNIAGPRRNGPRLVPQTTH